MKEKKTGLYSFDPSNTSTYLIVLEFKSVNLNEQFVQGTQIYCALFAIDYYQDIINTNIRYNLRLGK